MKVESIFPFLVWFKLVTKESIKADFFAGLTGAVIVLPQTKKGSTKKGSKKGVKHHIDCL